MELNCLYERVSPSGWRANKKSATTGNLVFDFHHRVWAALWVMLFWLLMREWSAWAQPFDGSRSTRGYRRDGA
jgi:hypothetical protein